MTDPRRPLPEYESPPVIEVVFGVQFAPFEGLTLGHLGRWWSQISEDFPECKEVPPILPVIERFEEGPPGPDAVEFPLPRLWLISKQGDKLIQLQKDRFLFNWRKTSEEHIYPRYGFVRSAFDSYRTQFIAFIEQTTNGSLRPVQYELTYINHIPKGERSWRKPAEIGVLLPDVSWRDAEQRFLPEPEAFDFQTTFILPDRLGRLRVHARHARLKIGGEVVLLEITARGFGHDLDSWFNLAHEWIVCGFTDMTAANAQRNLWRRVR